MRKFLAITFLVVFFLGTASNVQEKKLNFESVLYSDFKSIKRFGFINVSLEGSAEKIGLNKEELTDYLRLRFKNSFAGMEFKEPKNIMKLLKDKNESKKVGVIHVKVWMVGDNYPIAYYIAINAGSFSNSRIYESAVLGYGSKYNVPDIVKKTISELVDDLAISFFKARGEL